MHPLCPTNWVHDHVDDNNVIVSTLLYCYKFTLCHLKLISTHHINLCDSRFAVIAPEHVHLEAKATSLMCVWTLFC